MKKVEKRVVIITGASSGIGLATAKLFASKGHVVHGIARNEFVTTDFLYHQCDVTNEKSVVDVVTQIFNKEGKIDVLVNCAGMGISGSVENSPSEKIQKIFDVNFFGTVNFCKAVLPYMRKNARSNIVNISSVAGQLTIPFQTFYSATKSAIETLTEGLAMELKPMNIKVCAVLPGDTKTGFTSAREKNANDDESYGNRVQKSITGMEKDEQNGMTPESVAKVIYKVSNKKNPKIKTVVGFKYKLLVGLSKILPKKLVYKVLYSMYAK